MEILTARQKKAEELKRLTDLASQMAEAQLSELRAEIKVRHLLLFGYVSCLCKCEESTVLLKCPVCSFLPTMDQRVTSFPGGKHTFLKHCRTSEQSAFAVREV